MEMRGWPDLYAHVRTDFRAEFEDLLARIGLTGFGRDASVGMGHFEVLTPKDASSLLECDGANSWLNLYVFKFGWVCPRGWILSTQS